MIAVRCASGRVRLFEPSVNYFTNAVNHPDQGTGADMLKEALTRLHRDTDYRIVLPVHDEILLEGSSPLLCVKSLWHLLQPSGVPLSCIL